MKSAIFEGGDYVSHDLRFHQGLLLASHNRMLVQMSKALSALLRTSFEISTRRKNGPLLALPLHRAMIDAVINRLPDQAEAAVRVLIESARADIEQVLASRSRLPSLKQPPPPLRAALKRRVAVAERL
jgi:DNA-binding FadR family transcriptional regulator